MTLTPGTQAKLEQAFADKGNAGVKDQAVQAAAAAVSAAEAVLAEKQSAKQASDADALAAHQTATLSAHDALAAIGAELGFPLPS